MFTESDYNKLKQIMNESPENTSLVNRLLDSHQMTLSMISHEIRNPLTLVYSTLQLIESQHPEAVHFKYWSNMRHDLEYMILLLNDLSTYNNGVRLHLAPMDTNDFFRKLALSFAASLENKKFQFISKIDPFLPDILCDQLKLQEVLLNLLRNACDAITDSPDSFIRLTVTSNPTKLMIIIEDNGCGIPKENLQNIFEPFITYKKNGTGLGLAIASRIINSHNGTIHVSSDLCVGTTFTLTLPIE